MSCTSQSFFKAPNQRGEKEATSEGTLYMKGHQLFYQTSQMTTWQDGKTVASVFPSQRTIFLTRAAPEKSAPGLAQITMIRDSIIAKSEVSICRREQHNNALRQHIQLTLKPAEAARYRVKYLDFWFDPAGQRIQQIDIRYQPNQTISRILLTFLAQDFQSDASKLPLNARAQVLTEQGAPRDLYKGYQVVDQTTLPARK